MKLICHINQSSLTKRINNNLNIFNQMDGIKTDSNVQICITTEWTKDNSKGPSKATKDLIFDIILWLKIR